MTSLHDFQVKNITGKEVSLSDYKGNLVLIVNVASKCGLTPQYTNLQALYDKYKDKGFKILGFPSNDFMGQEPDSEEVIQSFCSTKYNVSFDMFSKVVVKGDNKVDLYKFLTSPETNKSGGAGEVAWNFQKYLVDKNGNIVKTYHPQVDPLDPNLIRDIEGLL